MKVLDATNGGLEELPDRFANFQKLQKVHLAQNKLKRLPPSICLPVRILHISILLTRTMPKLTV